LRYISSFSDPCWFFFKSPHSIFGDAGTDYVLEVKKKKQPAGTEKPKPTSYFGDSFTKKDGSEDDMDKDNDEVDDAAEESEAPTLNSILKQSAAMINDLQGAGAVKKVLNDTDSAALAAAAAKAAKQNKAAPSMNPQKFMAMQAIFTPGNDYGEDEGSAGDGGDYFEYDYDEYGDVEFDEADDGKQKSGNLSNARLNQDLQALDKVMTAKYGESLSKDDKKPKGGGKRTESGSGSGSGPSKRLRI
jgi:hypothetical protein